MNGRSHHSFPTRRSTWHFQRMDCVCGWMRGWRGAESALLPPPPAVPLRSECLPHCLPSARALLSGLWALWMLLPGQRAPLPPLWAPVLPPDTYILQSSKLFLLPQVTFSLAQTAPAPPLCSEPGSTGPSTPFSAFLTSPALPDSWFPITLSPSWPSFPSQARFLLHQQMTTAAYFIFKSDIK